MKNPPPLAPEGLTRDVRIGRHAAGVLLILPAIIGILLPFAIALFRSSFEFEELGLFFTVEFLLFIFLYLIAYFLLWRIASDVPTKTAALLLGTCFLFLFSLDLFSLLGRRSAFGFCSSIFCRLVVVYALSLLLRNRRLGASDRSWIGLLAVGQCIGIVFSFSMIWRGYLYASDLSDLHHWSDSRYYQIFEYGWHILGAIASWRLAHCPLFAGRRAATEPLPAGFYSPLNRYLAAVVIASAAAVGGLTLLYANAAQIVG